VKRGRPEHDVERGQIVPFYSGLGFDVYATSARVWAKGVTPGIPDLIVFSEKLGLQFFHETKLEPNRQSDGQLQFEKHCVAAGIPYVLGDVEDAMNFAVHMGIAKRVGPTVQVKPREQWPDVMAVYCWSRSYSRSDAARASRAKYGNRKVA